jgi:hypothetical protein
MTSHLTSPPAHTPEAIQPVTLLHPPRAGHSLALVVAPLEQVAPHEHHQERRVADLVARLLADGRLVNPPVAALLNGQYIVLDGATRLTAFRRLGYPHIILQVVDVERQPIQLGVWQHVVRGSNAEELVRVLNETPGLALRPIPLTAPEETPSHAGVLGQLITADQRRFALETASPSFEQDEWLDALNRLVKSYGQWGQVERTLTTDAGLLTAQYPDLAAQISFPRFTLAQVLALAANGRTVPAGITRFIIPGRILRLNAPLEMLASNEPLTAKQQWLAAFIQEKIAGRQVRYYEEPVVLLDE